MNQIVILAGGKGTRMQSELPKVLHPIKGVPIIQRFLDNIRTLFENPIVVVGYRGDEIISALGDKCLYIWQTEQLGTGHALMCAKKTLCSKNYKNIIVIPGDHPLISAKTLQSLIDIHEHEKAKVSLAVIAVPSFEGDFTSFLNCGRVIRNAKGEITGIIEYRDASEEQKNIKEVNVSYYCFDAQWLWNNIDKIKNQNKKQEFYLTDIVKLASHNEDKIASLTIENPCEGLGVNNVEQCKIVESFC